LRWWTRTGSSPKDANRIEIALTAQEVHEIRAQVLSDAMAFSAMDVPLSAAWLRQLGDETKAQMTEAMLHNSVTAPMPAPGKRKRRADIYEIDAIVEEKSGWYLVRWAGYHPSWEAWRTSGEVGSPVETCGSNAGCSRTRRRSGRGVAEAGGGEQRARQRRATVAAVISRAVPGGGVHLQNQRPQGQGQGARG
jgi:hypothetical protein